MLFFKICHCSVIKMISVTSSPVTKIETVGTMIDLETDVPIPAGPQTEMITETTCWTETDITETKLDRETEGPITDITKTKLGRGIDITKAMDIEIDGLMAVLTMRDTTTTMRRGTGTGTTSTLRD